MSAFKTWLNGLTSKTTPVDADEMYLRDSVGAASNKVTWANLKATLLTYFDTVYLKLTGGTVAGGTRTTSGSTLTITETLNNAGVTFPGALVVNVTNTASNAASLLADIKVDGASAFAFYNRRQLVITGASNVHNKLWMGNPSTSDNLSIACNTNAIGLTYQLIGDNTGSGGNAVLAFGASGEITWQSTNRQDAGSVALSLRKDADNVLGQRNGTNAQTSRTYGTYTDASNYRRVAVAMTTAGVASIAPEGAGTGASGNVLHISGLPTSNPGPGILWNDTGTVKVGT